MKFSLAKLKAFLIAAVAGLTLASCAQAPVKKAGPAPVAIETLREESKASAIQMPGALHSDRESSGDSPAPAPRVEAQRVYKEPPPDHSTDDLPSRTELEHEEYLKPRDAKTKLRLGYRLYCENARGPGIEKWLWILQFSGTSPEAATAQALVQAVNSGEDPFREVAGSPACSP